MKEETEKTHQHELLIDIKTEKKLLWKELFSLLVLLILGLIREVLLK